MFATAAPGTPPRIVLSHGADRPSPASTTMSADAEPSTGTNADGTALTSDTSPTTPSASASRSSTIRTDPPQHNGPNSSNTDTSKLNDVAPSTRSNSPPPNRSPAHATSAATDRCSTTTPFGTPVDPDVYITYAAHPGRCSTTTPFGTPVDPDVYIT